MIEATVEGKNQRESLYDIEIEGGSSLPLTIESLPVDEPPLGSEQIRLCDLNREGSKAERRVEVSYFDHRFSFSAPREVKEDGTVSYSVEVETVAPFKTINFEHTVWEGRSLSITLEEMILDGIKKVHQTHIDEILSDFRSLAERVFDNWSFEIERRIMRVGRSVAVKGKFSREMRPTEVPISMGYAFPDELFYCRGKDRRDNLRTFDSDDPERSMTDLVLFIQDMIGPR